MSLFKPRKLISAFLIGILTTQPALAAGIEYRLSLKTLKVANSSVSSNSPTGATGTGLGAVDAGTDPQAPVLSFAPSTMQFDVTGGVRDTHTSLLTNTGGGPATLSAIEGNTDFSVSHNCPGILAAGAACEVSATPQSTAGAGVRYPLAVVASGASAPATLQLSTFARTSNDPAPRLTLREEVVFLGNLQPGQTGAATATVTNTGTAAAVLGGITSSSGFSVSTDCPTTLAVGASCTVSANFASYASGTYRATLGLTSDASGATTPLTFYATVQSSPAIQPALTFSAASLSFDALDAGTSATKQVTLSNKGTAPALLSPFTSSRDFAIRSNCPDSLAVGATCTLDVTFNAITAGTSPSSTLFAQAQDGLTAELFLQGYVKSVPGSTTASLVTVTPQSLAFGAAPVSQPVTLQAVLANSGTTPSQLKSVAVDTGAGDFTQTNDCGSAIAPGATCTVSVTFKPTTIGTIGGRVAATFIDGSVVVVPLSGTGQAAKLSVGPTTVQLGAVALPGASRAQAIGVANSGNIALTGVTLSNSDNRLAIDYGTCTATLAGNQSCTLFVTYSPDVDGPFTTSFQIGSSNGGTASVTVSGTALRLVATPTSLTFPGTRVGASAADQAITLTNNGQAAASLDGIGITAGASQFAQANNCGTSLAAGAACTVTARFTPNAEGSFQGEIGVSASGMPVARIGMSGAGIVPKLNLSTASLAFPATNIGQSSAPMSFTVSNATTEVATLNGLDVVSGTTDFAQSNNCGTAIAPGASCTVNVQTTPSTTGGLSGALAVVSSLGTYTVALSGQGTQPVAALSDPGATSTTNTGSAAMTPQSTSTSDGMTHYALSFLDTEVGTSSAVRNITFSNKGDGPLAVQAISVVDGATDFAQSNNCGATLAAGTSCTISLLFTPSTLGARTGGMALMSDMGNYYFDLGGKGIGATGQWYASSSSDFGNVAVGSSAQRTFTLQNTGTIAAKGLSVSLTDSSLSFGSNNCGTSSAPITLVAGGLCVVTVTYTPTASGALTNASLVASGGLANGPVVQALAGASPPPALAFDAAPSGDYGTITAGTNNALTFTVRNTGKLSDSLSAAPIVNGAGFTLTDGTCAKGVSLPANGTCTVTVTASYGSAGAITGTITTTSTWGASAQLALQAKVIQPAYAVSGAAGSDTAPTSDFGQLTVGGTASTTNYYYLRDNSNIATVATSLASLVGDSSFTVTSIAAVDYSNVVKVSCTSTATGSTTSCSTGAPSRAIRIGVKFLPTSAGAKTATLHLEHNGSQGTTDVPLSGTGVFDAKGAWSTTPSTTAAPTATDLAYGTKTPGTTTTKILYVRNVGTHGAQATGFTLSGDTSQFKITGVYRLSTGGAYSCNTGGVVASGGGSSATPCLADDVATGGWANIRVDMQFAPTAVGSYSVTVTPTTNNGTILPGAITLTGTAQFNPTGAWSTNPGSTTAPTAADLAYGTKTTGTTTAKSLYVRNVGTNGAQATGFTLSGDTSQFKIAGVYRLSTGSAYGCNTGGVVASGGGSATPCLADDVATGGWANIRVDMQFAPTAVGSYSVTITPTTNNGTILPGAITLTGTAQFNPTGAWSTTPSTTAAPTATDLAYGTKTTGTTTAKSLYVRNVGTNGAQATGFTLSGDTSQFKIAGVYRLSTGSAYGCNTGGVVASGGGSATPCLADDVATGGWANIRVDMQFTPTAVGSYSVTITPTTNNGTILPGAITLTGTAQFNPTGAWSTNPGSTTAPTAADLAYGTKTPGTTTAKSLYVRNVGTNGAQATGFTLSGDTSQFKITGVYRLSTGSAYGCNTGGVVASGGGSATPCLADDVATGGWANIRVDMQFAPTAVGSYSVTVTPTTNNGTILPGAITLTGTAQ
jgi:hypothetical protein